MIDFSAFTVFIDPTALTIVGGGTLLATVVRGPFSDTATAFRALPVLWRRAFDFAPVRAELAGIERVSRAKGPLSVERAVPKDPDVAEGVQAIVAGASPDQVEHLLDYLRERRLERHDVAQQFWAAAAEAAPAMGMIGTLVGLVRLFQSMDDPATIGSAMAIALLATLYGALLANLIAAPISARLRRLSLAEDRQRHALVKPFRAFAQRETPIRQSKAA